LRDLDRPQKLTAQRHSSSRPILAPAGGDGLELNSAVHRKHRTESGRSVDRDRTRKTDPKQVLARETLTGAPQVAFPGRCAAASYGIGVLGDHSMPASAPNILFIVVYDCGYADLGCTGQTDYRTPALDRLAAEGVRFTQAYANSALCTNTRVALITGRYQYRLPIGLVEPLRWSDRHAPEMGLPPGFPTLPSLLRGAGYRTALIGKWHLGYLPRYSPLKSGYDEFFGVMGGFTGYYTHIGDGGERDLYEGETPIERAGYVTDLLSERAVAWIAAASPRPEPYFLSLHYTAPHWPWSAPSVESAARNREVERTELTEGGNTRIYGEMMQSLDGGIGRVLDAVRQGRGNDNTFVVFTSDNGGERFSKIWPFVGRKFDLLEGVVAPEYPSSL